MTRHEIEIQAEKLREFNGLGGSTEAWFRSKGFSRAEALAITNCDVDQLRRERRQTPDLQPVPGWLRARLRALLAG